MTNRSSIIRAGNHPFWKRFWKLFTRWTIRFSFHDIVFEGDVPASPDKSILLIGNHVSWWDGFWGIEVNDRLWKKHYRVMMLEEQLKERKLLRHAGAYSVNPGSSSLIETIRYTIELLESPQNLVQIFPQGKIHSLYHEDIQFQAGVKHILRRIKKPVQIIFFAAMIDYFSFSKPTIYYYLREWKMNSPDQVEAEYRSFWEEARKRQAQKSE